MFVVSIIVLVFLGLCICALIWCCIICDKQAGGKREEMEEKEQAKLEKRISFILKTYEQPRNVNEVYERLCLLRDSTADAYESEFDQKHPNYKTQLELKGKLSAYEEAIKMLEKVLEV